MIRVSDYIATAFSAEDADKIDPVIHSVIDNGEVAVLDFSGIRFFTTLFFNNAVTKYVVSLGIEKYNKCVRLVNLSDVGKATYEHSLDNAISYSKLSPEEREKAESIVSDVLDDL